MAIFAKLILFGIWQSQLCLGDPHATFHRAVTGVTFTPYVHNITSGIPPDELTLQDVETMIKVISTKFSKMTTFTIGATANIDNYKENDSYYRSYSHILAGEAAARVNKQMERRKPWTPIEMYLGIRVHETEKRFKLEISLANESVSKANTIFPKTVVGLVFSHEDIATNLTRAAKVLEGIKELENVHKENRVKLGLRQSCEGPNNLRQIKLGEIYREIIIKSNFVICQLPPYSPATGTFEDFLKSKYSYYKDQVQSWSKNVEIMLQTEISGNSGNVVELKVLRERWETADKWATKMGVTIWMKEAIDVPAQEGKSAHLGWWNLIDNKMTGKTEGYQEKASMIGNFATGLNCSTNNIGAFSIITMLGIFVSYIQSYSIIKL